MTRGEKGFRRAPVRFWLCAAAAGLLVHAAGLALLHVEPLPETSVLIERPYASILSGQAEPVPRDSFDRIALMDTSPLFLPTRWNTTSGNLQAIRGRKPGELFDLYSPELSFDDSPAAAELSLRLQIVAEPHEHLLVRDRFPFSSLGRQDYEPPELRGRFAVVEVYSFDGHAPEYQFEVTKDKVPESVDEPTYSADSLIFTFQVSSVGFMGSLFLVESSGDDELDEFFRGQVTESLREKGGLDSGYYRVEVGP